MVEVDKLEAELRDQTQPQFGRKTRQIAQQIRDYERHNIRILDAIAERIDERFATLRAQLDEREKTLKSKVREYKANLDKVSVQYKTKTDHLHATLKGSLDCIGKDKQLYERTITQCEDIIRQHHHKQHNYKCKNEQREHELVPRLAVLTQCLTIISLDCDGTKYIINDV
eukprot:50588_1